MPTDPDGLCVNDDPGPSSEVRKLLLKKLADRLGELIRAWSAGVRGQPKFWAFTDSAGVHGVGAVCCVAIPRTERTNAGIFGSANRLGDFFVGVARSTIGAAK